MHLINIHDWIILSNSANVFFAELGIISIYPASLTTSHPQDAFATLSATLFLPAVLAS